MWGSEWIIVNLFLIFVFILINYYIKKNAFCQSFYDILILMNQFHAKTIEESFIQLQSSPQGLSQEEALRRNKQYGINELPEKRKILPIFLYLKQFNSLLIYILLIAAVISFAVNHVLDATVIIAVVIVNSIVGFIQEYKAEKTVAALKKMIVKFAKVYRDGKLIKIPTSLITIGDIVLLEEGDAVPADGRLIEIKNLSWLVKHIAGVN